MVAPDLDELVGALHHRPPAAPRPIDEVAKAAGRLRRARRRRRALAAGGLVALVILGTLVLIQGEDPVELQVTGPTTGSTQDTRPTATGPEITIEPNGRVADGQSVVVAGVGFPAGRDITMSMCEQGVGLQTAPSLCDINATQSVRADDAGKFTATYDVRRVMVTSNRVIDCAEAGGRCVLGAADLSALGSTVLGGGESQAVAVVPLTFTSDGPGVSRGQVTAGQSENLRDGQPITLRGTGFRPGDDVYIAQCTVGEAVVVGVTCSEHFVAGVEVQVGDAGSFTTTFLVQRLMFKSGSPSGGFDDCAELSGGCELRIATIRSEPVRVAIAFDLTEPRPADPSLTIDEQQPLALGEEVTVRGKDFQPGLSVNIGNCLFPEGETSNGGTCGYHQGGAVAVDSSGSFVVSLPVIDDPRCAEGPDRCGLAFYPGEGTPAYARLPLTFRPPGQ